MCAWCHAGAPDGYSPAELRVYTNRDDLDFAAVEDLPPVQKWDLAENLQGQIELPTQVPLHCARVLLFVMSV